MLKFLNIKRGAIECDGEKLRAAVRDAYSAAARTPLARHAFPVGREFAESIGYPADLLDTIPIAAWQAFVGVSNVAVFSEIPPGATVLDVGCGAGVDTIIAAKRVGPGGKVIGVDFSEDMLARASTSVREVGLDQRVELYCAAAEELPIEDQAIDIALVNGIFNLNPKRDAVFSELARVVRRGGRVYAAEIVFTEHVETKKVCRLDDWFA